MAAMAAMVSGDRDRRSGGGPPCRERLEANLADLQEALEIFTGKPISPRVGPPPSVAELQKELESLQRSLAHAKERSQTAEAEVPTATMSRPSSPPTATRRDRGDEEEEGAATACAARG